MQFDAVGVEGKIFEDSMIWKARSHSKANHYDGLMTRIEASLDETYFSLENIFVFGWLDRVCDDLADISLLLSEPRFHENQYQRRVVRKLLFLRKRLVSQIPNLISASEVDPVDQLNHVIDNLAMQQWPDYSPFSGIIDSVVDSLRRLHESDVSNETMATGKCNIFQITPIFDRKLERLENFGTQSECNIMHPCHLWLFDCKTLKVN